jgi:hypothetical protein
VPVSESQTPETYLGTKRASNYVGIPRLLQGTKTFTAGELAEVNNWTLSGNWTVDSEGITAGDGATLSFRLSAKDVYVVTAGDGGGQKMAVKLNGTPISQTGAAGSDVTESQVVIKGAQLYRLVHFPQYQKDAIIELSVPSGVKLNAFTFGS